MAVIAYVIGGILSAVIAKLIADDAKAWLPWLTRRITSYAIRNSPPETRERLSEEWPAYLQDMPGDIGKLTEAIGFVFASVILRNRSLLDWFIRILLAPLEEVIEHVFSAETKAEERVLGLIEQINTKRSHWDWRTTIRHLFDRSIAFIGLLVLSPLLMFVEILIRLDSRGPSVFRQRYVDLDGRTSMYFKFRTLTILDDFQHSSDATTIPNYRVTRVGRFLRRTSLDELPILFNVIIGDLSLVDLYRRLRRRSRGAPWRGPWGTAPRDWRR